MSFLSQNPFNCTTPLTPSLCKKKNQVLRMHVDRGWNVPRWPTGPIFPETRAERPVRHVARRSLAPPSRGTREGFCADDVTTGARGERRKEEGKRHTRLFLQTYQTTKKKGQVHARYKRNAPYITPKPQISLKSSAKNRACTLFLQIGRAHV